MHILIVHPTIIPAHLYGGTQRVIWYLGKELTKLGHKVSYLVNQGSQCDFADIYDYDSAKPLADQIPAGVDLVHFNIMPAEPIDIPYLVTVHGNLKPTDNADLNCVFVSKNHAQRHDSETFVYNGLDWDDYIAPDLNAKRTHFHFLGKAAWRIKNVQGAIDTIKRTPKEKLVVLGGSRINFKMGFRCTLSPRISFKGMVGGEDKYHWMRHSKGLIFPVNWHEPFGLAITESLYFGSPVFGTPFGSLPELVSKEVGFLSNQCSELAEAILDSSDRFQPKHCHELAVDVFNAKTMAIGYLDLYDRVLSGETLNPTAPKIITSGRDVGIGWQKK